MMKIFVRKPEGSIAAVIVESDERICSIKRKLKEQEGIPSDLHLALIYSGILLYDWQTIAHYNISANSTLRLFLSHDTFVPTWSMRVKTQTNEAFDLVVSSVDTIDDVKAKIQSKMSFPPHKQMLFFECTWLEDGNRTLADYWIFSSCVLNLVIQVQQGSQSPNVSQSTLSSNCPSIYDTSDGEAGPDPPSSVLTELQDLKREIATVRSKMDDILAENKKIDKELTVARNKEKELEATISGLKAENNKTKQVLTIAGNKEKEVEATIAGLKAENNRTKQELTVFGNRVKELEVSISELMHKNKVFSAQCATYESQVLALEVENKIKEELMNADKKHYAGARAVGYAEGLKEGKTKWLKSVEFLHHLTDASVQYFNHGFDSCQKQAVQQGFVGQLNKDSALKQAPNLKGWECSALQE